MSGFHADIAALAGVSGLLRTASSTVEGVPTAPPPPRAGACTDVVNAGLAALCHNAATIVTGFRAAGDTTDATAREYRASDRPETFQGRP